MNKLFNLFKTIEQFNRLLNAGKVDDNSISFIKDIGQIYTQGTFYGGNPKIEENILAQKGAVSGICPLDSAAKVSTLYLPDSALNVSIAETLSDLPDEGVAERIYIVKDTFKLYVWDNGYKELSPSIIGKEGAYSYEAGISLSNRVSTLSDSLTSGLSSKVDKVEGKSLIEDTLIDKLSAIDTEDIELSISTEVDRAKRREDSIEESITTVSSRIDKILDSSNYDSFGKVEVAVNSIRSSINNINNSVLLGTDVVDNLESSSANKPLSANQGKVLNSSIASIISSLGTKVNKEEGKALVETVQIDKLATLKPQTETEALIETERARATQAESNITEQVEFIQSQKVDKADGMSLIPDAELTKLQGLKSQHDIDADLSAITQRLNTLADSADTTLDQMSEIVAYIKSNRELVENVITVKVNVSDIVDNLQSTATDKPLSANQGKILNDSKVDKIDGKALSTNDYTTAEKDKLSRIESGAQVNTVTSVAGKVGAVTLSKTDVGLANVDNTSDINKPVSTAQQAALDLKADNSDLNALKNRVFATEVDIDLMPDRFEKVIRSSLIDMGFYQSAYTEMYVKPVGNIVSGAENYIEKGTGSHYMHSVKIDTGLGLYTVKYKNIDNRQLFTSNTRGGKITDVSTTGKTSGTASIFCSGFISGLSTNPDSYVRVFTERQKRRYRILAFGQYPLQHLIRWVPLLANTYTNVELDIIVAVLSSTIKTMPSTVTAGVYNIYRNFGETAFSYIGVVTGLDSVIDNYMSSQDSPDRIKTDLTVCSLFSNADDAIINNLVTLLNSLIYNNNPYVGTVLYAPCTPYAPDFSTLARLENITRLNLVKLCMAFNSKDFTLPITTRGTHTLNTLSYYAPIGEFLYAYQRTLGQIDSDMYSVPDVTSNLSGRYEAPVKFGTARMFTGAVMLNSILAALGENMFQITANTISPSNIITYEKYCCGHSSSKKQVVNDDNIYVITDNNKLLAMSVAARNATNFLRSFDWKTCNDSAEVYFYNF